MESTPMFHVLCAGDKCTSEMVSAMLGFSGIEVIGAETIAKAMELSSIKKFDAHILGLRFPDGNGFDLCSRLKQTARNVPNVFYTGDVYPQDRERGIACGADAYLTKPYGGDLASIILELIDEGKQRSSHDQ